MKRISNKMPSTAGCHLNVDLSIHTGAVQVHSFDGEEREALALFIALAISS